MAFLIVAAITVPVEENRAAKKIERIGTSERVFGGGIRSAIRVEKRVWDVTTGFLTNANANTLEAAIASAAQVACSGDMMGGAVTCEVEVTDQGFLGWNMADGLGFARQLQLRLREV